MEINGETIFKGDPYLGPPITQSFGKSVLNCLRESRGNAVFQIDPKNNIKQSYAEFLSRTINTALEMQKRGVKAGDFIVICARNHLDASIPLVAGLYLGVATILLTPIQNIREFHHVIANTNIVLVFCDAEVEETFSKLLGDMNKRCDIIVFEKDFESFVAHHDGIDTFQAIDVDVMKAPAIVLPTSGTTGYYKSVCHTHKTLFYAINLCTIDEEVLECYLSYSPLAWSVGVIALFFCMFYGYSIITTEFESVEKSLQWIENFKVTVITWLPAEACAHFNNPLIHNYDLSSLRYVQVSGVLPTVEQLQTIKKIIPNAYVRNMYGSTEAPTACFSFDRFDDEELVDLKGVSPGQLSIGLQAKVVDVETKKCLGKNEVGELYLKGPCIVDGYFQDIETTRKDFDEDGWYRTGDKVYFDDDECVFIVGRNKECYKYKGETFYPNEIEIVVNEHPEIESSCVIGIPIGEDGEVPLAFVVRELGSKITEEDVINYVNDRVVDWEKLRGGVRFIEKMPMTSSGKIRRFQLHKYLSEKENIGIL